jgi:hypothetical protein
LYTTAAEIATLITNIETVLSGRITSDLETYTIAGRSITKIPVSELLTIRSQLKVEYASLTAAESVAAGTGNPNKVRVRF